MKDTFAKKSKMYQDLNFVKTGFMNQNNCLNWHKKLNVDDVVNIRINKGLGIFDTFDNITFSSRFVKLL